MRTTLHLMIGIVIAALVMHTWVALGLIVPVTVAGSSMAPTLLGPHRVFRCAACQRDFDVGLDQLPLGDEAICPRCNQRRAVAVENGDRRGNRLVINRTAFVWRLPRRWEVVVFRCPENTASLCVKRVVGLPGELVMLDRGDVMIDGRIVRKTLAEQQALRQLVYDEGTTSHVLKQLSPLSAPKGRRGEEAFQFRLPRVGPITDESSFNQNITPPPSGVPDVMLTFEARLAGSGQLRVVISYPSGRCETIMDFGDAVVTVRQGNKLLSEERLDRRVLPSDRSVAWTFSLFDRQVLVAIGDRTILVAPLDEGEPLEIRPEHPSEAYVMISAEDLTGKIRNVAVWRDVYYGVRHGDGLAADAGGSWRLGPEEFFVAGDNAAISDDSRSWRSGPGLNAKLLLGRTIGIR